MEKTPIEQANKADALRLKRLSLKRLLVYSGPDEEIQFKSYLALARTLGIKVFRVHEKVIRHQNATQFGSRLEDLTLAFRGLGKSTVGTVLRSIGYIIRDLDIRIGLTSDTKGASVAFHKEIYGHLSTNADLIDMFGAFYVETAKSRFGRYADGESTIRQRRGRTIKEATICCLGIGGQAASRHFDVIFGDDLVTLAKSRTPTMRKALSDWSGSTLIGTGLPHTKYHYLGTRYFPNDHWDDLVYGGADEAEGPLHDAMLRIPLVEDHSLPMAEWVPTHPERYNLKTCRRLYRRMGRYHFLAQMQQDTKTGEGIVFSYPDFRWYGNGENLPPNDCVYFQYSDLSAKETEAEAFHVTITFGVAKDRGVVKVWVVDMVRFRGGLRRQRETIIEQVKKWGTVRAGVESVAMQTGFAEEIAEGSLLPVMPWPTGRAKGNKEYEAQRVTFMVENHRVFFPLPETAMGRITRPLINELSTFPNTKFKDCVDAFVGGLDLIAFGDFFRGPGDFYGEGRSDALELEEQL